MSDVLEGLTVSALNQARCVIDRGMANGLIGETPELHEFSRWALRTARSLLPGAVDQRTENRLRLYVDGTIAVPDARGPVTRSFGPFARRDEAESAVVSFIARENAMGAVIRDPDA